jgi:hypothetical protein
MKWRVFPSTLIWFYDSNCFKNGSIAYIMSPDFIYGMNIHGTHEIDL